MFLKRIDSVFEQLNSKEERLIDFKVGLFLFQLYSVCWLFERLTYLLVSVPERKGFLIVPTQWLARILFQFDLDYLLLASAGICAFAVLVYQIAKRRIDTLSQFILFISILVINTYKVSFGFLAHVDHLFMLAHFLLIAYPKRPVDVNFVSWFQVGLLLTYTLAGLLKIIVIIKSWLWLNEPTWLHPGIFWQQVKLFQEINHRFIPSFFETVLNSPAVGILLMITAILTQLLAVFSVMKKWSLSLYCFLLIMFHLFNYFVLQIYFHHAIAIVFCFLFPFTQVKEWIRKNIIIGFKSL
ncbi:MAG: hypothetical protein SNJ77_05170 [Cytophagales bacterium]